MRRSGSYHTEHSSSSSLTNDEDLLVPFFCHGDAAAGAISEAGPSDDVAHAECLPEPPSCNWHVVSSTSLAEALAASAPSLTRISMRRNRIDARGARALGALCATHRTLRTLDLSEVEAVCV